MISEIYWHIILDKTINKNTEISLISQWLTISTNGDYNDGNKGNTNQTELQQKLESDESTDFRLTPGQ